MLNKKTKQIFCELYDQFSEEYDDLQILKAAQIMYDSLGEKYHKVDYSHRDYFFTGLPKAVDTAFDNPWKLLHDETKRIPTYLREEWSE